MVYRSSLLLLALSIAGSSLFSSLAQAQSAELQIRPTAVHIQLNTRSGVLTLENSGDGPASAQVDVLAWSQQDGVDVLVPTDEVIVSPMIVNIEPQSSQVVRLMPSLNDRHPTLDRMYRVVVQQIPHAEEAPGMGVVMRMRYTLPLFVHATAPQQGEFYCQIAARDLICHNTNGRAVQMGSVRLVRSLTEDEMLNVPESAVVEVLSPGLMGYVLPNSTRRWQDVLPPDFAPQQDRSYAILVLNYGNLLYADIRP